MGKVELEAKEIERMELLVHNKRLHRLSQVSGGLCSYESRLFALHMFRKHPALERARRSFMKLVEAMLFASSRGALRYTSPW